MSSFFNNKVNVESIGKTVTIPNNDIARLMYYLSCVGTVINYDNMDTISDYEHYYLLNAEQKEIILKPNLFVQPAFTADVKDKKAYAELFALLIADLSAAPLISGLVGFTGSMTAALIVLGIVFAISMFFAVKIARKMMR